MAIITDIALAIIAVSIGGSLQIKEIKQLGPSIFVITLTQALGAVIAVCIAPVGVGRENALTIPSTEQKRRAERPKPLYPPRHVFKLVREDR